MTEKQQDAIDEIMDNFNFETCSEMMLAVDFGWYAKEYPKGDVPELRKFARKHLRELCKSEFKMTGTGGFEFEKGEDEESGFWLTMSFIPESISTYPY